MKKIDEKTITTSYINLRNEYTAVARELIYHGRHFSAKRDEIAIQKCVDRLLKVHIEFLKQIAGKIEENENA